MRKIKIRNLEGLLWILGCFLLFLPFTAYAQDKNVVRIGYYRGDDAFQAGFGPDERKSGYAYEYYQELAAYTGWTYEYVYGSRSEITEKLINGQVDIAAGLHKSEKLENSLLFSAADMGILGEECYFACNRQRGDLIGELDRAMEKIREQNPHFELTLNKQYYSGSANPQMLTDEERAYLEEKGVLKIGYMSDSMPISGQDKDGNPVGIAAEVLELFEYYLNIPIEGKPYRNLQEMIEAVDAGEIDAAFPVRSDRWINESLGLFQCDTIISDQVIMLFRGPYAESFLKNISVSRTGLTEYYLRGAYPDSEITAFDNYTEAIDAVLARKADCYIGCASVIQRIRLGSNKYLQLNAGYMNENVDFTIGVDRSQYRLLSVCQKVLSHLDSAAVSNSLVRYSEMGHSYTLANFVRANAVMVVLGILLLAGFILILVISYMVKLRGLNRIQEETNRALQEAYNLANRANEAKTRFLSSMSHDIRTPMNAIIGMTAIANTHLGDPDRIRECLGRIEVASKHLLGLINEVLDMNKIETGKVSLAAEEFNLGELINNLISLFTPLTVQKRQEFIVNAHNLTHELVIGDAQRIQQVFTNLLSNAVKYTQEGGQIKLTITEKPVGRRRIGFYEFIFEDNGIGMPPEFLSQLFEPFSRADDERAQKQQGTGLGMAIAKNIVQMMNGDIEVESELDTGSKFTITFYLELQENEDAEDLAELEGLSVLVVDDDEAACESACELLDKLGMKGEWVTSGEKALERIIGRRAKREDFFAVILDWKMPGMDGVETARAIRREVGEGLPLILSSFDWPDIEMEARQAGVNAFLSKPLFRSRMIQMLNWIKDGEEMPSEEGSISDIEALDFHGKRALLVEDNELNAEIAGEILGMTGLAIEYAKDGREAVDRIVEMEDDYYDVIFMDIQMPVMDGYEATRAIRSLPGDYAKRVPIIAMTANAFAEDVQMARAAGMNEHVSKPIEMHRLSAALKRWL